MLEYMHEPKHWASISCLSVYGCSVFRLSSCAVTVLSWELAGLLCLSLMCMELTHALVSTQQALFVQKRGLHASEEVTD
jgi:hypothetical protein